MGGIGSGRKKGGDKSHRSAIRESMRNPIRFRAEMAARNNNPKYGFRKTSPKLTPLRFRAGRR